MGFGRGTFGYEYGGFGVDEDEAHARFRESVSIVQGLWTTPEFSHDGRVLHAEQAEPRATATAIAAPADIHRGVIHAGRRWSSSCGTATSSASRWCRTRSSRWSFAAATSSLSRGRRDGRRHWKMCRSSATSMSRRRRSRRERTRRRTSTGYWTLCSGDATSARAAKCRTASQDWRRERAELPLSFDYISDNRAFIGTPDQCAAKIAELRAQGVGKYFGCNFAMGGIPHDKVMRSMRLFAEEVMPRFVD